MDDHEQTEEANLTAEEIAKRRAELDELRRVMAELPIESPDDGLSGADHDKLLYRCVREFQN